MESRLTSTRITKAACTQREAKSAGLAVDDAFINDQAIRGKNIERESASSHVAMTRAVNLYSRPAIAVLQGEQIIDKPGRQTHDAGVSRLNPDVLDILYAFLDGREQTIVERTIFKGCRPFKHIIGIALHRYSPDRSAGKPGAPQLCQSGFASDQATCTGRIAEDLIKREGNKIRMPYA